MGRCRIRPTESIRSLIRMGSSPPGARPREARAPACPWSGWRSPREPVLQHSLTNERKPRWPARARTSEYEPKSINEVDHWNNDDLVELGMSDGSKDPVNTRSDDEIRGEPYKHSMPKGEGPNPQYPKN
jgi:hypothetical protein